MVHSSSCFLCCVYYYGGVLYFGQMGDLLVLDLLVRLLDNSFVGFVLAFLLILLLTFVTREIKVGEIYGFWYLELEILCQLCLSLSLQ